MSEEWFPAYVKYLIKGRTTAFLFGVPVAATIVLMLLWLNTGLHPISVLAFEMSITLFFVGYYYALRYRRASDLEVSVARGYLFIRKPGDWIDEISPKHLERPDDLTLSVEGGFRGVRVEIILRFKDKNDADILQSRVEKAVL